MPWPDGDERPAAFARLNVPNPAPEITVMIGKRKRPTGSPVTKVIPERVTEKVLPFFLNGP